MCSMCVYVFQKVPSYYLCVTLPYFSLKISLIMPFFIRFRNVLAQLIAYAFAALVLVFTVVMVTKILPYMTFERAINFLGTKSDAVLDRTYFMVAFYIHITSSVLAERSRSLRSTSRSDRRISTRRGCFSSRRGSSSDS